jgi:beta-glucosidase
MTAERDQAREAVAKLSLDQKLDLTVGADFWRTCAFPDAGIPSLRFSDGSCGLRAEPASAGSSLLGAAPATCYPAPSVLGCTWDPALARKMGESLGEEARLAGVDVVLAPAVNLKRNPLCGRNFEYYSEDPVVAAHLATSFVGGMQGTGTGACVKHFAANSQEFRRTSSDSLMDQRTLHELYLLAFELVVRRARPECVMTAYNRINGTFCSDSVELVYDTLRRSWGFDGLVVSDWGGLHDRAESYRVGCDLAMPGGTKHLQRAAREAIAAGGLDVGYVDASAERVAEAAIRHENFVAEEGDAEGDETDKHDVAYEIACEGQVLLKNDGLLPLKQDEKVALIGPFAARPHYQGQGSSRVTAGKVPGLTDVAPLWAYAPGCGADGVATKEQLRQAAELAAEADVAICVIGTLESAESEGYDRESMRLPDGFEELVRAVASANPRCCVVLQCGSPVEMPWEDAVAAVLYSGLGGECSSEATYDLLTGRRTPSGHLAETWPVSYEDVPCSDWWGDPHRVAEYREGLYVGYRYYSSAHVAVRHPFGHGLSYATFAYSDLEVDELGVSFHLVNESDRQAAEVSQLYVVPPADGPYRPRLELAGFARTELAPHELRKVSIPYEEHAFDIWTKGGWKRSTGTYQVIVAQSAEKPVLESTVTVGGSVVSAPAWQEGSWYEHPEGKPTADDLALLRSDDERPIPAGGDAAAEAPVYDETSSLSEMAKDSKLAAAIVSGMRKAIHHQYEPGGEADIQENLALYSSVDAAIYTLVNTSGGKLSEGVARRIINAANKGARRRRRGSAPKGEQGQASGPKAPEA